MPNPAIALLDADMEVLDQHVLDVLDFATEFEIETRPEYDWAYRPPVAMEATTP